MAAWIGRLISLTEPAPSASWPLPERDQIGALAALILLAYGLIRIVVLPTSHVEVELLGLAVQFEFNARTMMVGLSGALAAIGSEWVMQPHPLIQMRAGGIPGRSRVMPALAALGAGAVLPLLPIGPIWVLGLGIAGGLIFGVLLAEFVALDRDDPRAPAAAAWLRSLGLLIVVGVTYAARASGLRAIFVVPTVFATVTLVSWRAIGLSAARSRAWLYAVSSGLLAAQLAWALHYWPVNPVQMALLIGLVSYLANGLGAANLRAELRPGLLYEFAAVAVITAAVALFVA